LQTLNDYKIIFNLKLKRKTSLKSLLYLVIYKDNNNILVFKSNCVNVINKDNIFISNIYKDIIYFILFVNIIKSLKVKGKGL